MARQRTDQPAEIRGDDVPLNIGVMDLPQDAATNPDAGEMPDAETKGYHTGLVRQPAEPVLDTRSGAVRFESERPSKFDVGSLADLKAAHNQLEASGIPGEVEHRSTTPYTDAIGEEPARRRRAAAEGAVEP
jgi:hypothetical protein